eukprot:m.142382 g.142382  ORF g.142382 m.142382 type:complete len:435 (+) comp38361_c0_seq2:164-1468(+)
MSGRVRLRDSRRTNDDELRRPKSNDDSSECGRRNVDIKSFWKSNTMDRRGFLRQSPVQLDRLHVSHTVTNRSRKRRFLSIGAPFGSTCEINDRLLFSDLSNNRIHFIDPKAFKYFRNLLSLDLSSNLIGALPEGVLAPMISLQQLDLSYNQLDLLGERPFQGLPNLLRLRMNNNKLKKVWSDLFEGLSRLLVLHLEGNEINTIEKDSFIHLHMMEDLNLASNYLSDSAFLSNAFRRPNKIKRLLLSKNELLTIANTSFFYFPYLERLDLSYNNISYIDPDALMIQDRLYYVFLSNNPLRVIKKGLFGPLSGSIKLLDFVEASLNKIEPGAFAYLTGVQELSLSHNYDLTYLDDDLFLAMTSLEKLVINNVQQLKKLPRFRHHDHLTGIAAHITGFEVLQDDFCEHVPNLLDLDLGYGNLRSIPSFSNCTKLRQM